MVSLKSLCCISLRLLLQESPEENKEKLSELFKIEQYVEMVLGYLRTEDMSSDLKLSRCSLDRIIRDQIHKYAGIFVSKKLTLTYESISQDVLTDEKWLGFVIGQILSNALKYTRTGGIRIYLEKKLSLNTDRKGDNAARRELYDRYAGRPAAPYGGTGAACLCV